MTQNWFSTEDPSRTGGKGSIGILYDSTLQAIVGLNIGHTSVEGESLDPVLRQCNEVRFTLSGSFIDVKITNRQAKENYTYFFLENPVLLPSGSVYTLLGTGSISETGTLYTGSTASTIFIPYLSLTFYYSGYNPTQNNVQDNRKTGVWQIVDTKANQVTATNISVLLEGLAEKAQMQEYSYESQGQVGGRYEGTKLTSIGGIYEKSKDKFIATYNSSSLSGQRDEPILSFYSFTGSLHPLGSEPEAIWNVEPSNRVHTTVYFNTKTADRTGTTYLPISGSVLYVREAGKSKVSRVTRKMVFSTDTGYIYTTDAFGQVSQITT